MCAVFMRTSIKYSKWNHWKTFQDRACCSKSGLWLLKRGFHLITKLQDGHRHGVFVRCSCTFAEDAITAAANSSAFSQLTKTGTSSSGVDLEMCSSSSSVSELREVASKSCGLHSSLFDELTLSEEQELLCGQDEELHSSHHQMAMYGVLLGWHPSS